ncbi:antitoxin Xre/MbcA/ParS toxin-binding domain-containing protein [Fibrella sp. WM1]|uniref:type II RES/Xre toxin-antitoxin system antitoxin n=1 Tax=Fibrella musci TaxID=3242485 RepID=UPI0035222478
MKRIVDGLGGMQFFKRPIQHEFDLMEVVREGLPIASVEFLRHNFGLTNKQMSTFLAISESTYQRRLRAQSTLTPDETEKAISLSELYEKGMEVFENKDDLEQWFNAPVQNLQNRKPIDLLDTMLGRAQVMTVLNALLHGIYL